GGGAVLGDPRPDPRVLGGEGAARGVRVRHLGPRLRRPHARTHRPRLAPPLTWKGSDVKIELPDTDTRNIAASLLEARENNSQTTGRVLTLIVIAALDDDVDHIISVTRDASHEHPARVLVLLTGREDADSRLDAAVRVGGLAGASDTVIMRITGDMVDHHAAVVAPLLLPDTPVVAWWPTTAPANPSEHPLGRLAQRRITNADHPDSDAILGRMRASYAPGDSDMVWSKITA